MIERYWGEERFYHHTAPISMLFALREGLRIILEEGLGKRFKRHQTVGDYLKSGLMELGWKLFAQEGYRLPMLTSMVLVGNLRRWGWNARPERARSHDLRLRRT